MRRRIADAGTIVHVAGIACGDRDHAGLPIGIQAERRDFGIVRMRGDHQDALLQVKAIVEQPERARLGRKRHRMSANDHLGTAGQLLAQPAQVQPTQSHCIGVEVLLNSPSADG